MNKSLINFYNIKFYNCSFKQILSIIDKGGYLVAPAASSLSKIKTNKKYYNSLIHSRVAILDSGFFCILLRIFKGIKVKKLSGYLFLKKFLEHNFKKKKLFLNVDPSHMESKYNLAYFKKKKKSNVFSYVAPKYNNKIEDKKLLKLINKIKPDYVLINLGGEIQEILAQYLEKKVNYKVSILCTGAAIAFLTKRQAPINDFIDKYYLGWFVRLLYDPLKYYSRILDSINLITLFIKK